MTEYEKLTEDEKLAVDEKNYPKEPETYAAVLRIYMEWLDMEEEDQLALVVEGVKQLKKKNPPKYEKYIRDRKEEREKNKRKAKVEFEEDVDEGLTAFLDCCSDKEFELMSRCFIEAEKSNSDDTEVEILANPSLYNAEFDEYINEIYTIFLDQNRIAGYLQKVHRHSDMQKEFSKIKTEFKNRVFGDWERAFSQLSEEEFDTYIVEDLEKRKVEYEELKKSFQHSYTGYPELETLFYKLARKIREHLRYEGMKAREVVYMDDEKNKELQSMTSNPERVALGSDEVINDIFNGFDDIEKRIVILRMAGYKMHEIAADVGISISTVSRKLKKIESTLLKNK